MYGILNAHTERLIQHYSNSKKNKKKQSYEIKKPKLPERKQYNLDTCSQ